MAKSFQNSWKNFPVEQKKKSIENFGDLIQKNIEDLAKTLTTEVGKPIKQSRNEIKAVQGRLKFFLDNVDEVIKPRIINEREEVRFEPLGIIANISAWNYPYFVGVNVFVPALLTGNIVLYKPSEYATLTGQKIAKLLREAGIPPEAFIPFYGKGNIGEQLVNFPDLNGIFFTGSNATGSKISEAVRRRMIKLQLELGGKDPAYVREDVEIEKTVKSLADGAMYNTGQSCCSVERIYVHSNIYQKFVDLFVQEVKSFVIGHPMSESTYIGPLTLPHQPEFLEAQVQDAVSKGAKVLIGGKKMDIKGNWFEPTVLVNVNHSMDVMKEESFGPIIGIQEVKNDEEAIELMNDTKYGLTAAVYTKSKEHAEKILSQINSGTVYWNACDRVSPNLPWTGRKCSGIGCTLGLEGIQNFIQPKSWHLIGN
jgi:acyl-CoA reductase-like NAD-dependent aldehyde dehydrogenase